MNKEKMIKAGFESDLSDEIMKEAWAALLRFFEKEETINDRLDEVIANKK